MPRPGVRPPWYSTIGEPSGNPAARRISGALGRSGGSTGQLWTTSIRRGAYRRRRTVAISSLTVIDSRGLAPRDAVRIPATRGGQERAERQPSLTPERAHASIDERVSFGRRGAIAARPVRSCACQTSTGPAAATASRPQEPTPTSVRQEPSEAGRGPREAPRGAAGERSQSRDDRRALRPPDGARTFAGRPRSPSAKARQTMDTSYPASARLPASFRTRLSY